MLAETTKAWTNIEIAKLLRQMAAAYTILGKDRFRIIAYDNAATAVEHATSELKDLWDEGKLDTIPGLGPSIREHLDELFKKGQSTHFKKILSRVHPAVFPLLEVPGIGPKKAQALVEKLHIKSAQGAISELEKAAKKHRITPLANFGAKSEEDILGNIKRFRQGAIKQKRMVLPEADAIADELIDFLRSKLGQKIRIDKLGSLRRQVSTIGDIDLAVATDNPEAAITAFVGYPKRVSLIEQGPTGASLLLASGRQADLRVSDLKSYGAMLQYFTGSKYHNIRLRDFGLSKGYSLNEYGIIKINKPKPQLQSSKPNFQFSNEKDFYNFLSLDYIPPELREDQGEIEAAKSHKLPKLIELEDVKGDLQMHSDFDQETSHDPGENSMSEMWEVAESLGYEYIGITNHNPSTSGHTSREIVAQLQKQQAEVEKLNQGNKHTRIINLLEIDILPDGSLPVPDEGLDLLDGCLVSIHSSFTMNKEQMTKRVLTGLSHPQARIFAHPTGRLLEQREGYELDWEKIFAFCLDRDKALEINAYPNRLDLPDTLVREAVKRGVRLSLGTDAHHKENLNLMKYGVAVARRGWAEPKDIINTWDYNRLIKWIRKRT